MLVVLLSFVDYLRILVFFGSRLIEYLELVVLVLGISSL